MKKKYIIVAACCFAIIAAFTFYYFFTPLNAEGKTAYIYIDNDDNIDSVINKIRPHSRAHAMKAYRHLCVTPTTQNTYVLEDTHSTHTQAPSTPSAI